MRHTRRFTALGTVYPVAEATICKQQAETVRHSCGGHKGQVRGGAETKGAPPPGETWRRRHPPRAPRAPCRANTPSPAPRARAPLGSTATKPPLLLLPGAAARRRRKRRVLRRPGVGPAPSPQKATTAVTAPPRNQGHRGDTSGFPQLSKPLLPAVNGGRRARARGRRRGRAPAGCGVDHDVAGRQRPPLPPEPRRYCSRSSQGRAPGAERRAPAGARPVHARCGARQRPAPARGAGACPPPQAASERHAAAGRRG